MTPPCLFAFLGFDSVGPAEMMVLLAVVLIVVGPKNIPAAARKIGRFMSSIRRAADEFKRQLMTMDAETSNPSTSASDPEPPPPPPPDPPPSDTYIDVPQDGYDVPQDGGPGAVPEPSEPPAQDGGSEPSADAHEGDAGKADVDDRNATNGAAPT